jgi:hypothetical protein
MARSCYGLVIEEGDKITISGDPFIQIDSTDRYQILRSTYFSLKWFSDKAYKVHFVKYKVQKEHYLRYAHILREKGIWRENIIATFDIIYNEQNTTISDDKTLGYISTNSLWKLTMNIFSTDLFDILTLPYVTKIR